MIYPKSLEKDYLIGVTATSAGCDGEVDLVRLQSGIHHFKELGYSVEVTKNVQTISQKGRSSDARTRAKELEELFSDTRVRAVITYNGGDYLVEMLSFVDFNLIKANPKWVQGYSDTTGLTFIITTNCDIATLYAENFSSFGMKNWHYSLENNIKILEGKDLLQESFPEYQDAYHERSTGYEEYFLDTKVQWKNLYPTKYEKTDEINMQGRALVGCLDVILCLIGTRFDKMKEFIDKYKSDKILWFLESFDLSSESLTRGLWQLKEAGWFEHAAGFVFGRPAMYRSDYEITYEEAVLSALGDLNLPIILEADFGHKPPQFTMMNGAIAHIHSKDGKGNISFERR